MRAPEAESHEYVQVLDSDGNPSGPTPVPEIPDEELLEMYRQMRLARHFDERTISLQRQGRMGTYTPMAGQEGAQVGSVHALGDDDWFVPSYREHGAKMALGMAPEDVLVYWKGNEIGNRIPDDLNVLPDAITVGNHVPYATGMAWAAKLQGEERAFLCNFGDGATSQGALHEGLNFAGVFDVPIVYLCNNNQWAISHPSDRQTGADTFAQKAHAFGFEGVLVDGMDPLAVYHAVEMAVEKAKDSGGDRPRPTLVEAKMYRFGPHTTADDPSVYRDQEELDRWKARDPIPRLQQYLKGEGLLDDERDDAIQSEIEATVASAIETAEAYDPDPASMFEHAYAELPPRLEAQFEQFTAWREEFDGEITE
jgi:pyruvate dehydrogenase E1 component alpha subunit